MLAISLQSGSSGNCIYVETEGVKLLFDAGISGLQASRRLAACGRDIRGVDALIISHDHADHIRHAGVYQRKFGLPVFTTPRTLESGCAAHSLGRLDNVEFFHSGEKLRFNRVSVQTIPSPHDGVDGVAFVVSSGEKCLGILTDLGHVFKDLVSVMTSLDAVFIESNYDPEMLARGPYPAFLKRRIAGPRGHLSNIESAELLQSGSRLKWACLAHLSGSNNHPVTALRTHRAVLGAGLPLYTADRYAATEIFRI
ncbi:MAG: MBL fold metallo-hydrolase [Nitrospirae bacterium]|nr:MBL fold metallo-hydrolase [Nitrospirota bacterium]